MTKNKTINTEFGELELKDEIGINELVEYEETMKKTGDSKKSFCEMLENLIVENDSFNKKKLSKLDSNVMKEVGEYYIYSVDEMRGIYEQKKDDNLSFFDNFYITYTEYVSLMQNGLKKSFSLVNKISDLNDVVVGIPLSDFTTGLSNVEIPKINIPKINIEGVFPNGGIPLDLNLNEAHLELSSALSNLAKNAGNLFDGVTPFVKVMSRELVKVQKIFESISKKYSSEFSVIKEVVEKNPVFVEEIIKQSNYSEIDAEKMKDSVIEMLSGNISMEYIINENYEMNDESGKNVKHEERNNETKNESLKQIFRDFIGCLGVVVTLISIFSSGDEISIVNNDNSIDIEMIEKIENTNIEIVNVENNYCGKENPEIKELKDEIKKLKEEIKK